jgi:hypothetical protein
VDYRADHRGRAPGSLKLDGRPLIELHRLVPHPSRLLRWVGLTTLASTGWKMACKLFNLEIGGLLSTLDNNFRCCLRNHPVG